MGQITQAQTTTFDYKNSDLSTSDCNVFDLAINISSVKHMSRAGGVGFNASYGIQLATNPQDNPQKGTAYIINYSFAPGYNYDIKITASGNKYLILRTSVTLDYTTPFPTNSTPPVRQIQMLARTKQ